MAFNLLETGLPFNIQNSKIFHFKLPSIGPHRAVHLLWKQPYNSEDSCPEQLKLVTEIRKDAKTYYTRAMKQEIQGKILYLGIIKQHQARYIIKDPIGDDSAPNDETDKNISDRLDTVICSGNDIVVDLRKNNGKKPKFDSFWDVVADFIEEKTAIDDRRHTSVSDNEVVVNIAVANSHADMCRQCIRIAKEKHIDEIPRYAWFLLQFWPTSRSVSKLFHYTGRFKVRHMVQARLLRKKILINIMLELYTKH